MPSVYVSDMQRDGYAGVLLDAYGTILTSPRLLEHAVAVLSRYGVDTHVAAAEYTRHHRATSPTGNTPFRTHHERFAYIGTNLGLSLAGNKCAEELSRTLPAVMGRVQVAPDAAALLTSLEGATIALVTNADTSVVKKALGALATQFAAIVTSEEVRAYKPAPALHERALRNMGLGARDCLVIGDDHAEDCVPGINLGMSAVCFAQAGVPDNMLQREERLPSRRHRQFNTLTAITHAIITTRS